MSLLRYIFSCRKKQVPPPLEEASERLVHLCYLWHRWKDVQYEAAEKWPDVSTRGVEYHDFIFDNDTYRDLCACMESRDVGEIAASWVMDNVSTVVAMADGDVGPIRSFTTRAPWIPRPGKGV